MSYICTRTKEKVSSARAILRGLSPAGGLYVPEELPKAVIVTDDGLVYLTQLSAQTLMGRI